MSFVAVGSSLRLSADETQALKSLPVATQVGSLITHDLFHH
jgi:hypothetical protein